MSAWQNVNYDYHGAAVLVTGGTSGIGAGIAAAYREAGAEVTITGTRPSAADYDGDLAGYHYLQLSLTDKAQIAAVAARLPRLDILVNNAGANFMLQNEYDPEIFEKGLQVNLGSAYRMSNACRGKLAASKLSGGCERHRHRLPYVVLRFGGCPGLRRRQSRTGAAGENARHRLGQGKHPRQRGGGRGHGEPHDRADAQDPGHDGAAAGAYPAEARRDSRATSPARCCFSPVAPPATSPGRRCWWTAATRSSAGKYAHA